MQLDEKTHNGSSVSMNIEEEVLRRYGEGAHRVERGLCCPTKYESKYMDILPPEIIEKDYGCGDPSQYVNEGDTVIDLGSGAGKICYMLSQKVGASGRVIGVDFNDEMLKLARKYLDEMKNRIGYGNVRFVKAKIQDLQLDLEIVERWLNEHPVNTVEQMIKYEHECERLRKNHTLIPNESADVVVSNCVLNLVTYRDRENLFKEIYRVLKRGGRAVISDIVCDETPTQSILTDEKLWSGCISGSFREDIFLEMFEHAGFYGIKILKRQENPWQVIDGIEFRSVIVSAFKGKEGICLERNQSVAYKGPWKKVCDDDGHTFYRGKRMAVCDKTFSIMTSTSGPYCEDIIGIPPYKNVPVESSTHFDCKRSDIRHPHETKGLEYRKTEKSPENSNCGPDCC